MASASGNNTYHYTLADMKQTSRQLITLGGTTRKQLPQNHLQPEISQFAHLLRRLELPAQTHLAMAEFANTVSEIVHTEADTLHAVGLILEDFAQHLQEADSQAALAMRNHHTPPGQP